MTNLKVSSRGRPLFSGAGADLTWPESAPIPRISFAVLNRVGAVTLTPTPQKCLLLTPYPLPSHISPHSPLPHTPLPPDHRFPPITAPSTTGIVTFFISCGIVRSA